MPFEKNEFMPAASIIEKLTALDSNAPYDISTRAAIITCRRHDEASTLSNVFLNACRRGWKHFEINMLTYSGPHAMGVVPENAFEMQETARKELRQQESALFLSGRGDDLRLGILDYMSARNLTPQSVGLDKAEQDSLELLLPKKAPRDPSAVAPQPPIIWPMP